MKRIPEQISNKKFLN